MKSNTSVQPSSTGRKDKRETPRNANVSKLKQAIFFRVVQATGRVDSALGELKILDRFNPYVLVLCIA
jgi:hypothetical protein